jgi:hypothetical protein
MEKSINRKIHHYVSEMKDNIRKKSIELGTNNDPHVTQLVQYICDYGNLTLQKDDFVKRKRVKNVVHLQDRCCARKANGEQCTRQKKGQETFCGTHLKGAQYGVCDLDESEKPIGQKIEVWAQDIQGIIYYIDKNNNVYQMEDIMHHNVNPKVIAKYVKNGDTYSIPEFGI